MDSLPAPDPRRFANLEPQVATLDGEVLVWRVYRAGGRYPAAWNEFRAYGPVAARFDHHEGTASAPSAQDRAVYYCAPDLRTALAEAFQTARHVDLERGDVRATAWYAERSIPMLDLWGLWTTRMGCDQRIHTTPERSATRRWARALYEAYPTLEGLRYRSKMAGTIAWCLNERAAAALSPTPLLDLPLAAAGLRPGIEAACAALGYSVG